jgi:hypothetical protein
MNINYTHFKTIAVCLLLVLLNNTIIAQLPKDIYTIEYKTGVNKNEYIWLVNKTTNKKTKVMLPEPSYINETPRFETDYILRIPAIKYGSDYLKTSNQPFYLYAVREEGGFFLLNPKLKNNEFTYVHKFDCYNVNKPDCYFEAAGAYFNDNGEPCNQSYTKYVNKFKYDKCIGLVKNEKVNGIYFVDYFKDCKKMQLTTPVLDLVDFGDTVLYMLNDSIVYYSISQDRQLAKLPSLYSSEVKRLEKLSVLPTRSYKKDKRIPVRTGQREWAYMNEKMETPIQPFTADLALPFLLPKEQAPVFLNGKWGIMNTKGEMTVPFRLDSISIYSERSYYNIQFKSNDTIYAVDPSTGKLKSKNFNASASNTHTKPERKAGFACLVYILENPDKTGSNRMAYILVSLTFNADNIDHAKMSSWVLNRIDSEILALQERGYYRTADLSNNNYDADLLYEKSCYYCQEEYKAKSLNVIVIEKRFD